MKLLYCFLGSAGVMLLLVSFIELMGNSFTPIYPYISLCISIILLTFIFYVFTKG